MECNKDEATKAKEIADKKLIEMDLVAAKKFALKAQNLYPELEGLPDLLASLHVYSSAEEKVNGEVDWYGVIGVEASADDDTIRRHYKQMALALHPDKNKSVGADGAFKILSQAWSVLSDKNKKILYDRKRKLNGIYGKMAVGNPSVMTDQNGFHIFTSNPYSNIRDQKIATRPPFQHTPRPSTFWTTCPSCIMQFEYAIMFLRTNLICPSCRRQFLAVKTQPPNVSPTPWTVEDMNSNGRGNAPMDCWELDPAALPLELLQVVESKEGEVVVTAEDGRGKDLVGDIQETREEQIMETVEEAVEKVATKKEAKKGGMLVYSRRR